MFCLFASGIFFTFLQPVLRIRIIRNHVFLVLLDPDPDPSIIKQNSKNNLDYYCFVNSFDFLSLKNYEKLPSKSNMQNFFKNN
jgi:hypothetical protein